MKWNREIQLKEKQHKSLFPSELIGTDRSRNSANGGDLGLKSVEKARHEASNYALPQVPLHTEHNQNQTTVKRTGNTQQIIYTKESDKLMNTLLSLYRENIRSRNVSQEITNLIQSFIKDLQDVIAHYSEKLQTLKLTDQYRQQYAIKIANYVEEVLDKTLVYTQENVSPDRLKYKFNQLTTTEKGNSKEKMQFIDSLNSSSDKGKSSQSQSRQKGKTNSFAKIQTSFNQVNKLLDKVTQPRFMRTSKISKPRNDRDVDSSVEQIIEKSLQTKQKGSRSQLKTNDALYNLNKILNM